MLLKRGRYKRQAAAASGWVRSPGIGLEMHVGQSGKLLARMRGNEATQVELPED